MNREHARWLRDGEQWTRERGVVGKARESDNASFWLKGPAAAFVTLPKIVHELLAAEDEYSRTGNEQVLKTVYNTTLGEPYIPKLQQVARTTEELRRRAVPILSKQVPEGVRFLVATVDVQANRFEVQVHGFAPTPGGAVAIHIIDRFHLKVSERTDGRGNHLGVEPHEEFDDWKMLVKEVLLRTYPLADDSGRVMGIHMVGCDSAGAPGVTANAYRFWRWLTHGASMDEEAEAWGWVPGLQERFILVRGDTGLATTAINRPRVKLVYPDSGKNTKYNAARGDVPVLRLNTQLLKDEIAALLLREGEGRVIIPDEMPRWFFAELAAEVRDERKGWINPQGRRNEAWDLLYYARGVALSQFVNVDNIDWNDPPHWATEWDENELVFDDPEMLVEEANASRKEEVDRQKLGEMLA
jgi:phage terminase large subunit GpA-like protein